MIKFYRQTALNDIKKDLTTDRNGHQVDEKKARLSSSAKGLRSFVEFRRIYPSQKLFRWYMICLILTNVK